MLCNLHAVWVTEESFIMFLRLKTWINFNHLAEALNKYLYWLKMTKVQVTNGRFRIWCPCTNTVRDCVTKTEYFYPSYIYVGELHIAHFSKSRQGYLFPISRLLIPTTTLGKAYVTDHGKLHSEVKYIYTWGCLVLSILQCWRRASEMPLITEWRPSAVPFSSYPTNVILGNLRHCTIARGKWRKEWEWGIKQLCEVCSTT